MLETARIGPNHNWSYFGQGQKQWVVFFHASITIVTIEVYIRGHAHMLYSNYWGPILEGMHTCSIVTIEVYIRGYVLIPLE